MYETFRRAAAQAVRSGTIIAGAAVVAATSGAAKAESAMPIGGSALAPPAFYEFCSRDRQRCNSTSGGKIVKLTARLKAELRKVNSAVNGRIREQSDQETNGADDYWELPGRVGDCEDFAIAKKHELMQRGWPASALLITVARMPSDDDGHTVLTVRTTAGDLILDSRRDAVSNWRRTPYRYFARQSQRATGQWDRIASF
jgi:predicted transglutaminase-like cysteine proteinase